MKSYLFTGTKYITKGISEGLPEELVMYLWDRIEDRKRNEKVPMDWLQVFELSNEIKDDKEILTITHSQEVPPHKKVYKLDCFTNIAGKIFVIDDIDHMTMLFASEY